MAAHLNVLLVDAHADPHEHVLGALHHLPIDSQQVGSLQGLQQSATRHLMLTSGYKVHGRYEGIGLLQRLKQPEMLCLPHRQLHMAAKPTKISASAGGWQGDANLQGLLCKPPWQSERWDLSATRQLFKLALNPK